MPTIADLIPDYRDYLAHERKFSPATVAAYIGDLRCFARWSNKRVDQYSHHDIRAYIRHLSHGGCKPATIIRKCGGFSTFWKWLVLNGYAALNILVGVPLPKKAKRVPEWLSEQELRAILDTPSPYHLAWAILVYTGVRSGELQRLEWSDANLDERVLLVRAGKGQKDRLIPMPDSLIEAFQGVEKGEGLIFPRLASGQGRKRLSEAFKAHMAAAGLPKGITPKTIRHSYATHLVRSGVHITIVKDLMGHADIATTMKYIHHDRSGLARAVKDMRF